MLKDLKSKLPLKKKNEEVEENDEYQDEVTDPTRQSDPTGLTDISSVEDIDEEEEGEAPQSLVDKIKAQIAKFSKSKKASADDEEESESGDEEEESKEKPKKKIGPIHIIAILAIIYFAADEFLIPKEPAAPEGQTSSAEDAMAKKIAERRKNKEAADAAKAKDEAAVETPAETPAVAEDPAPSDSTPSDIPSVDSTAESTTPTDIPAEEPTITETPTPPAEEPVIQEPTTPETTITETQPDTDFSDTTPMETIPSETGVTESKDTIDGGMVVDDESDTNLTDKILQDLEKQANKSTVKSTKKEYISPPDYEYKGRGLVYNCVGKHWACIDAPSYKACEDNSSSTKTLGKSLECYPFNVYENSKGCENMQRRMVSSSAKTKFCNE